jgi:hypothetical protein
MAYGIVHHFAGGTEEQYRASIAAVHPNGGSDLPDGQIFHAAGPSEGGWTAILHPAEKANPQGGGDGWFASRDRAAPRCGIRGT